jgi:hypothetical protein
MKILAKLLAAWSIAALAIDCLICVPCGLVLLALALRVVWLWGSNLFVDAAAAFFIWLAAGLIVAPLHALASQLQQKRPAPAVPQHRAEQPTDERRGHRRRFSR